MSHEQTRLEIWGIREDAHGFCISVELLTFFISASILYKSRFIFPKFFV